MNPRLIAYLRSLGASRDASQEELDEFFRNLRGTQAAIANCLNHNENDSQAAGACDIAIRAMGFDPLNPTSELVDGSSDDGDSGDGAPDLDAVRRQGAEAEAARRTAIAEIGEMAGTPAETLQALIDDPAITVEAARQRIRDEHRSRRRADSVDADLPTPGIRSRNSLTGVTERQLLAAVIIERGGDPVERWIEVDPNTGVINTRRNYAAIERDADIALESGLCHMSLEDQMRACAQIDGVDLPRGRMGLMEYYQRSGSTAALQHVWTQSISAEMVESYDAAPDSTGVEGLVRVRDVADFKKNERPRMTKGEALQKLPRGGEAEHATYEDTPEEYKIARYARQFQIDDQDVIDDSMNATGQHSPAELGEAAAEVRPDIYYSILLANATMGDGTALFDASRGNLLTTNALTSDNLGKARAAMKILQENSRNLNIRAQFVIIPPALEDALEVLLTSRDYVSTDAARTPSRNPNFGKGLVAISDARLENGLVDPRDGSKGTVYSGSATTWFISGQNQRPIEIGYLRGTNRRPQVRSWMLTQGKWGVGWDIKIDIGGKALKPLGLQKSTA